MNAQPHRPPAWRPRHLIARTLWDFAGFIAGIVIVIPAVLLGLEYGALSIASRLYVAAISLAGVLLLAGKHALARRRVRD